MLPLSGVRRPVGVAVSKQVCAPTQVTTQLKVLILHWLAIAAVLRDREALASLPFPGGRCANGMLREQASAQIAAPNSIQQFLVQIR